MSASNPKMASAPTKTKPLPAAFKAEVKADPDADTKRPIAQPSNNTNGIVRVKDDPAIDSDEPQGVDQSIPMASDSEEDMFDETYEDDEDGPIVDEIVDLTYEGLVHINGIEHFVCKSFKIRQIPQPTVQMIDLQSLFGCLEYGSIVLNPDYQRETVWDEHRASTLINSILMGYFVPPIIFNRKLVITQTPQGKNTVYKKVCVDGKQRLTSLHKFMSGQIGIWDSNLPQKKWYFCHPRVDGREALSTHNIMPKAVRDFFTQRRLCCYEYNELPKDTEENMFQLVQRGLALSPAEKMRAMSTEWATFAKQFEEDYEIVVNLSKQNRASGFRIVLTIFAMIQEVMAERTPKSPSPALQASAQALSRLLEDRRPLNAALKLKIKGVFDKLEALVKLASTQVTATRYEVIKNTAFDPAPDYLRAKEVDHGRTFSPLELLTTAVLVTYHMESRSEEQLLNDIKDMRHHIRLKHKDLRINTTCWGTAWLYISRLGTIPTTRAATRASRSTGAPEKAPRAKKPKQGKHPAKKTPKKPPRRKPVEKNSVASATSSELSSAPSSEDESDFSDEDMNVSFSPIFPGFMPNRSPKSSSPAQATPNPTSETEVNDVPSQTGPSLRFVIEDPKETDKDEYTLAIKRPRVVGYHKSLSMPRKDFGGPKAGERGPADNPSYLPALVPRPDPELDSLLYVHEPGSIELRFPASTISNRITSTSSPEPSNEGRINSTSSRKSVEMLPAEIKPDPKKVLQQASFRSADSSQATAHNSDVRNAVETNEPKNISPQALETGNANDGLLNGFAPVTKSESRNLSTQVTATTPTSDGDTGLVSTKAGNSALSNDVDITKDLSKPPNNIKLEPDAPQFPSATTNENSTHPVFIKLENDDNLPDKTANIEGSSLTSKPKSRFVPSVPNVPRPERKPETQSSTANSGIPVVINSKEPSMKRPHDGHSRSQSQLPKKPKT